MLTRRSALTTLGLAGYAAAVAWAFPRASYWFAEKHTCPVCGQRSVFRTVGDPPRPNAQCPACGSLERHRLLYLYLRDRTPLFRERLSVLHFSPEPGLAAVFESLPRLTYKTSWYEKDRNANYHLDLTKLDLPDASWDVLIAYHIFEHIPEDRAGMREMFRVLRPGGWAVLQVPVREGRTLENDPTIDTDEERYAAYGQHDHVRYYGWQDFADRLGEAGFHVAIERYGRALDAETIRDYALVGDERIYVARKPGLKT
jgi:predicted SAM-dependent methyltransferase